MIRIFALFIAILNTQPALACKAFCACDGENKILAKSFDWHHGNALVVVNKRNVVKKAVVLDKDEKTAEWTSKYGSITFNNVGKEFPFGGMNEKGLAIEVLWREGTKYPPRDERPGINESQWIQRELDTSATIEEAIENAKKIRIAGAQAAVHYFACDASGKCATFEHINGELVIHTGKDLPIRALGNDTYESSIRSVKTYETLGGKLEIPKERGTFLETALAAEAPNGPDRVASAFKTLDRVEAANWTKWQIVYALDKRKIYFRTADNKAIKTLSFDQMDLSCKTPAKTLYINDASRGDVSSRLVDYSTTLSKDNLQQNDYMTQDMRELLAIYPDIFTQCIETMKDEDKSKTASDCYEAEKLRTEALDRILKSVKSLFNYL